MPVNDYIMVLKPSATHEQRIGGEIIDLVDTQSPLIPVLLSLQNPLTLPTPNHPATEISCPRVKALGSKWASLGPVVEPSEDVHPADLATHDTGLVVASLNQDTQEKLQAVDVHGPRLVVRPGDLALVE